ncbi:MAG: hypothetical protein MJ181_08680 [Treponema sp.]|nr:hypothetical protein [Treponema sp.]
MKKTVTSILLIISAAFVFAQSHFSGEAHHDAVTQVNVLSASNSSDYSFISSGDDGFLIKWSEENMGEHYQVSDVGIKIIATSPNGHDIAVYETDGGSVNKVTVWDWNKLSKKYTKKLKDSVTSLSFSEKGNYLIIGTATIDGAIFVKTSDWTTVNKVRENTSIVNFIKTSSTEKTAVMYSPSGTLTYYNILTGKTSAKFNCIQGLSDITMFCNDLFLAGSKDNYIYIIQATTGKTLSTIPCNSPIILSSKEDEALYYIEYDGKNLYELKMVEKINNSTLSNQRIVKGLRGPRGDGVISSGKKRGPEIFLGSRNGNIYKSTALASSETETMEIITENVYDRIYDIAENEDDFFILTKNAISKVDYETGYVIETAQTNGENSFICANGGYVLFSKETRSPVTFVTKDSKPEVLFTPKSSLQNIRLFGDILIEIESSSKVNIYDFNTKTFKEVFSGMGIQDAVICEDGKVYIAKSASTSPNSPLISVDPVTLETLPLKMEGQVMYGLSTNGKIIYGMNLRATDTASTTYVTSYNTAAASKTDILKFAEEDPDAFTYLSGNFLYTNIGKNKIYSYNLPQKKRFAYERTASMPEDICKNSKRVVILNRDGSISWGSESNQNLTADWYLTKDGQWCEF